eukprot:GGOE01001918.1.p1 GENE.GGOE01001918.1~~GGOE01001918.1.p1  ORF type:complete len:1296 (-),score=359.57 GGOE01001918.1:403-4221(-)
MANAILPTLNLGGLSMSPDMTLYTMERCPRSFTLSLGRSQQVNPITHGGAPAVLTASATGEAAVRRHKRKRPRGTPANAAHEEWPSASAASAPTGQANGVLLPVQPSSSQPMALCPDLAVALRPTDGGARTCIGRLPGLVRSLQTYGERRDLLRWFRQTAMLQTLVMGDHITNDVRRELHVLAGSRIKHQSFGPKNRRIMLLLKSHWDASEGLGADVANILARLVANSDLAGCAFRPCLAPQERSEIQQNAGFYGLCTMEREDGPDSLLWVYKEGASLPPLGLGKGGRTLQGQKPPSRAEFSLAAEACIANQKAYCISRKDAGKTQNQWLAFYDGSEPAAQVMRCPLSSISTVVLHQAAVVAGIKHCYSCPLQIEPPLLTQLQLSAAKVPLCKGVQRHRHHHPPRRPPKHMHYNVDEAAVASFAPHREGLPISAQRASILHSIRHNPVTILEGPTGSGKTTQVPQYIVDCPELLPQHRPVILVTQPRRIAAINTAMRVATERGQSVGEEVGYQVRFDSQVGRNTRIIFMTSGILLRRLQDDPTLVGVGCVVIDEVHERTLDVDFCLLLVKQLLLRGQVRLKVVVMSATLQAQAFVDYFAEVTRDSPMDVANYVTFEGRMFHVWPFYVEEALHWTGFRTDPERGMAYRENSLPIIGCGALLLAALQDSADSRRVVKKELRKLEAASERARQVADKPDVIDMLTVHVDLIAALVATIHQTGIPGSILVFLPGLRDIDQVQCALQWLPQRSQLLILPVHSLLPRQFQTMLFQPAPRGKRKVVLATNIAESSITIDDITFVIDSGLMKGLEYDPARDISSLNNVQVSQANALQRRGRAGRVRPGICIHLFPRSMFDRLTKAPTSELLRVPLEEVGLRIKALGIADVHGFLAQAIDVPETRSIDNALLQLQRLGALDAQQELTDLGWLLAGMPLHPRLGKLLVVAAMFGVLQPVTIIAAFLSVRTPFVATTNADVAKEYRELRAELVGPLPNFSDHIKLLRLYRAWEAALDQTAFCTKYGLHSNTLKEVKNTAALYEGSFQNDSKFRDSELFNRCSTRDHLISSVIAMCMYPRILLRDKKWHSAYDEPPVAIDRESTVAEAVRKRPLALVSYGEQTATEGAVRVGIVSEVTPLAVAMVCRDVEAVERFVVADAVAAAPEASMIVSCDWWLFLQLPSLEVANTLLLARSALAAQLLRFAATRDVSEVDVDFIDAVAAAIMGGVDDASDGNVIQRAPVPETVCRRLQPHEREWIGVESDESDPGDPGVLVLHDSEDEQW